MLLVRGFANKTTIGQKKLRQPIKVLATFKLVLRATLSLCFFLHFAPRYASCGSRNVQVNRALGRENFLRDAHQLRLPQRPTKNRSPPNQIEKKN